MSKKKRTNAADKAKRAQERRLALRGKGNRTHAAYDTDMVRDFIGQLKEELRVRILETTLKMGEVSKEHLKDYYPYLQRRKRPLLSQNGYTVADMRNPTFLAMYGKYREAKAEQAKAELAALKSLERLFNEAFDCAELEPGKMRTVMASLAKLNAAEARGDILAIDVIEDVPADATFKASSEYVEALALGDKDVIDFDDADSDDDDESDEPL